MKNHFQTIEKKLNETKSRTTIQVIGLRGLCLVSLLHECSGLYDFLWQASGHIERIQLLYDL